MNPGRHVIQEFKGVALDVHRSTISGDFFQVDVGGDRLDASRWRRRRGMRHTDAPQKSGAVTAVLGFELNQEVFGLVVISGAAACGLANVREQNWATGGGYGESEFGEGEFGE